MLNTTTNEEDAIIAKWKASPDYNQQIMNILTRLDEVIFNGNVSLEGLE